MQFLYPLKSLKVGNPKKKKKKKGKVASVHRLLAIVRGICVSVSIERSIDQLHVRTSCIDSGGVVHAGQAGHGQEQGGGGVW